MQESNELRTLPLLVVVVLQCGICLKNGHFGKCIRHLHRLLWNSALCAQGYPQKMWNENTRASPNLEGRIFGNCLEFLDSLTAQALVELAGLF